MPTYSSRPTTNSLTLPGARWLSLAILLLALAAMAAYNAWSPTQTASAQSGACSQSDAVVDPEEDMQLVGDCNVLLGLRDTLAGDAELNWSANVSIRDWDGVRVAQAPPRVVSLRLEEKELSGSIPSDLAELDAMEILELNGNMLTGSIPPEIGSLVSLRYLYL